jgi:hypothetical protein
VRGSRSGAPKLKSCSRNTWRTPVFSASTRAAAASSDSFMRTKPPGNDQRPRCGCSARRTSHVTSLPSRTAINDTSTVTEGRSKALTS